MTDNVTNFQLRYVGERFNGARLPVDVLGDLPAFRDLIISFVKESWRLRFSQRRRLPKGFDRNLTFDLVRITEGSAIPNLNWNRSLAQAHLPGVIDELDQFVSSSFEKFVELIDCAEDFRPVQVLSPQQIRALNRLGAGLRDDERIEFLGTNSKSGGVIYLDIPRRRKILTRIRETYETRIDGIGTLVETRADGYAGHLVISTEDHGYVRIDLDADEVADNFAPYLQSEIQYDLQVEVDSKDQVRAILEIHDIGLIDEEYSAALIRCFDRLEELSKLSDGWLDGEGIAIAEPALVNARRLLVKRKNLCGVFRLYPNDSGNILIEFENSGWGYTIEFRADSKIEMFAVELKGVGVMEPTEYLSVGHQFLSDFDKWVMQP